jgi:conjugal transfer pilus assembly protein TraV
MKHQTLVLSLISTVLSACSSLNGVTGSSDKFGCKAPDGVSCNSVSGTYANAQANNLPSQRSASSSTGHVKTAEQREMTADYSTSMPVVLPGMPIRSDQRTMRVWIAPWVDSEGDLHDQTYLYLVVDPGKWQIEHTKVATAQQGSQSSKLITSLKTGVRPRVAQSPTATAPIQTPAASSGVAK